jgi:peptidylprolyl isomerase
MSFRLNLVAALVLGVLSVSLVACGGSKAPGVQLAPSAGLTQEPTPKSATTTSSTPSTTSTSTTTSAPKVPPQLSKKPVVKVPSGPPPKNIVTKDLIKGNGATAQAGKTITVNYVGVLYSNGKQFDASWDRNQPFTTPLTPGSVISGWVLGLSGMKVGGRRELVIPPQLAYGKAGQPPTIPGNSALVFVVDLLSVS